MLAKKTFKNQITIPKGALEGFEGVEYFDVFTEGGNIILRPVYIQSHDQRLKRIREKISALGLKETDIDDAIHWARAKTT